MDQFEGHSSANMKSFNKARLSVLMRLVPLTFAFFIMEMIMTTAAHLGKSL